MGTQGQSIVVHRDQWAPDHLALLCGIANAGGGVFIIGAGGKSHTSGLRRMRRPFEQIPRLVEKELGIECHTEPVLDGAALCLEVTIPAADKPIAYEGTYWLYDMDRNVKSSRDAVQAILDRTAPEKAAGRNGGDPWETRQQPLAQQRDMNAGVFMAIASLETGEPDLPTDSLDDVFEKRLAYLGLRHPQTRALTNAGVLLLHNQPERFIPGALVQLELFAQGDEAVLQNSIAGPLGHQLNEALRMLYEQYLPMAGTTPGLTDDPAAALEPPPQQIVRGALLCALAHKDYECGRPLVLRARPKRIDLICPLEGTGAGSEGLISSNGDGLISEVALRNPILSNALRLMGIMDDWSESFEHLAARCAENGLEPPAIQQDSNGLLIAFPLEAGAAHPDKEPPPPGLFPESRTAIGSGACGGAQEQHSRVGQQRSQERTVLGTIHRRRQQPRPHLHRRVCAAGAAHQRPGHGRPHSQCAGGQREHGSPLVSQAARTRIHRARGFR